MNFNIDPKLYYWATNDDDVPVDCWWKAPQGYQSAVNDGVNPAYDDPDSDIEDAVLIKGSELQR